MTINVSFGQYPTSLQFLYEYAGHFLTEDSKALLIEKKGIINKELTATQPTEKKWSISIPQSRPLTFVNCEEKKVKTKIDVSFDLHGTYSPSDNKNFKINNHCINVRIWSLESAVSFREQYDATELRTRIEGNEGKRVMVRFHIDKKIQDEDNKRCLEPLYHLHFGGNAEENELVWHCDKFEEPRFTFFPFDLVLLTEFILSNYFPKQSKELREGPQWKRLVQKSQELFIKPYIEKLNSYVNNKENTLLSYLEAAEDV